MDELALLEHGRLLEEGLLALLHRLHLLLAHLRLHRRLLAPLIVHGEPVARALELEAERRLLLLGKYLLALPLALGAAATLLRPLARLLALVQLRLHLARLLLLLLKEKVV